MLDWLRKAVGPGVASTPSKAAAEAWAAHDAGDWQRAVTLLQPLAQQHPDDAQVQYRLGDALYQLERAQEALAPLERAARLAGNVAAHHYKLGNALKDLDRREEALACYRRALEIEPRHAQSLTNTGVIREMQGRTDEALDYYRRAIEANGALLPARINLSVLLHRLERHAELEEVHRGLRDAQPRSVTDWCDLGHAYLYLGRQEDAVRCYQCALELDPMFSPARISLLTTQLSFGMCAEAIAGFRKVLEAEPDNVRAACNLLLALLFEPGTNAELFAEHLAFGRRFAAVRHPAPAWNRRNPPGGRIRVGYVSADLARHPIGYNLAPILRFHDRSRFEVYLYSDVRRPDDLTRWFSEQGQWRPIAHLPDEAAARQIREDEIDVLVVLAGRFEENRILLVNQRAAPVQASMHDPATSGLAEMDYLIADRNLVPRHASEQFTERVACLPTFFLHPPLDDAPRIAVPPAVANGWITFGSFNNPAKISESVVALWAQVLRKVPASRLLLKYHDIFMIPVVRSRYLELFRKHGVGEERLVLPDLPAEVRTQHLGRYAQIDISLDPFPFAGSTTTFESLWMGVPVVTLQGDRMVARWSAAMLKKIGLSRLIARDESEYVEIAGRLAADLDELGRLRAGLRERVAHSPLCAEQTRTRQLERLYRRMLAIRLAGQRRNESAPAGIART